MMAFLADLGAKLIEVVFGDLMAWINKIYTAYKARKAIQAAADASVAKLNTAKTGQEIDDASTDVLDGF